MTPGDLVQHPDGGPHHGPLRVVYCRELRDGRVGVVAAFTRGGRTGEPVDWVIRADGTIGCWGSAATLWKSVESMVDFCDKADKTGRLVHG